MIRVFKVRVEVPSDIPVEAIKDYIDDAVGGWCGQFHPPGELSPEDVGDPLWNIRERIKPTTIGCTS